jgi:hypothetical protein
MPIKTYCPACDAPVTAPATAAGETVDCCECGAEVKVPRAQSRSSDDDDRDDRPRARRRERDDQDDDDRPRSRTSRRQDDIDDRRKAGRRKRRKKSRLSPGVIIGVAGGGVFVLVSVVGLGAWLFFGRATPDRTIDGEAWYKAAGGDGLFTAHFPGDKPKYDKVGFRPPEFLAQKAGTTADELAWKMETWSRKDGGREYSVMLFTLPSKGASADAAARAAAATRVRPGAGVTVVVDETVTVGGHQGQRVVTRGGGEGKVALSFGIGSRQLLLVLVSGPESLDHTDPKVVTFLDNFSLNR